MMLVSKYIYSDNSNYRLIPILSHVWNLFRKRKASFYLRLRNEFQPFSAQNQASDWVTKQVNELNAWFLARNGWNSFLNLRLKVTATLNIKIVLPSNFFNPHQYKIMDNAPKYLVGCVIQKRFLYTHSLSSLESAW